MSFKTRKSDSLLEATEQLSMLFKSRPRSSGSRIYIGNESARRSTFSEKLTRVGTPGARKSAVGFDVVRKEETIVSESTWETIGTPGWNKDKETLEDIARTNLRLKNEVDDLRNQLKFREHSEITAKGQHYTEISDLRSENLKLQERNARLQSILTEVSAERDALSREKFHRTGKSLCTNNQSSYEIRLRSLRELFSLLWSGLLRHPSLNPHSLKQDFRLSLEGKTQSEFEFELSKYDLGFSQRELSAISDPFTVVRCVDLDLFFEKLVQYQPYVLLEDLKIESFRVHFALKNLHKTFVENHIKSANLKSEKATVKVLSAEPLALPLELAEDFASYLWRNQRAVRARDVNLADIPDWDLLRNVIQRIRLEMALENRPLDGVLKLLPAPLTYNALVSSLMKEVHLTMHQSQIFAEHLFSENLLMDVSEVLGPSWKTKDEVDAMEPFAGLNKQGDLTTLKLWKVAQRFRAANWIPLDKFLTEYETEIGIPITEDQRVFIELFSYEQTNTVNVMDFKAFFGWFCKLMMIEEEQIAVKPDNE